MKTKSSYSGGSGPTTSHPPNFQRSPGKGSSSPGRIGFTRLELLFVLSGLGLLALLISPALAGSKWQGDRVTCLNNLRQIGQAFRLWASDHEWQNPWWTCVADGGTMVSFSCPPPNPPPPWYGLQNSAWFQFAYVSNELVRPSVLACPSDGEVAAAVSFTINPQGGFLNPNYRNNAASYFIGLEAYADFPEAVLAGDRNMKDQGRQVACSTGITAGRGIWTQPEAELDTEWLPALHGEVGNVVLNDGQVRMTSSAELRRLLRKSRDDNGVLHFLYPR